MDRTNLGLASFRRTGRLGLVGVLIVSRSAESEVVEAQQRPVNGVSG